MPIKLVPHTSIAFLCALAVAVGQEPEAGRGSASQQGLIRPPAAAARIEDEARGVPDPGPAPPATLVSHSTTMATTSQADSESCLQVLPEPPVAGNCFACGGTCGQCSCRCTSHLCPPARWNVIGRMCYGWNTRTKPCLQASHWGYPEEFCERPFGSYVRANLCAQVVNGLQDQLILYRYDFIDESLTDAYQLKSRGRYELAKIIALIQERPVLQGGFNMICVEESGNPTLDEARRQHVVQQLALLQFPLPSEQVVVGRAKTPGISGEESLAIYTNLVKLWESGNQQSGRGHAQRPGPQVGGSGLLGPGLGLGSAGAGDMGR